MKNYKSLSDKKLLSLCVDKNPLAWFEFVARFKRLVSYAIEERLKRWGYSYQSSDVEDIKQDVFLSVWEKDLLKSLKHPEKIVPWLAIISANKAVSYFRKRTQGPKNAALLLEADSMDIADRRDRGPLTEAIFKDSLKNILKIVKGFSVREKNILRLSILYSKTHAQIADLLKMPSGSVSSIIKRAKVKIEKGLKK